MKNSNKGDTQQRAINYAFLLLKFRLRSEKELFQRLKDKKFDIATIKKTLSFLKEKGFVNDEDFACAWIESRLKKPFGLKRIKQELKLKGIANEIIDKQISRIKENYSEEELVLEIARNRLNKLKDLDAQKAKRRVFAYLARRGYSPEVICEALHQL